MMAGVGQVNILYTSKHHNVSFHINIHVYDSVFLCPLLEGLGAFRFTLVCQSTHAF